MLFPRNGRRRGGRWLAALAARGRVDGIGPGVVSPGMGLAGARLLDALERRERREPSSCPPGRFMLWMSGWGSSLPPECSAAPAGARDRDRSRRHDRPGRAAATFLVLGLLLLGAAAAEAQTPRILVSNSAQSADDSANTGGNDHAQLFHTAGATNGYTLTSLIVVSEDAQGDDFSVKICEADNTTEFPTSTCTELREPDSFAAGSLEFTHAGMHLNRNDNYVAVFDQNDTGSVTLDSTTSGGEDPTGITGWSIKDKFDWNNGGTWQQKSGGDEAFSITVKGYETPANQDATGRPIILASAEGAPILFADTSDIADGNGRPYTGRAGSNIEFVYSYQWIRVDGGTEIDIGVDSPSYLLVDADIGNLIKVQVSFTDRATYSETVTSLPFRPVARPPGPSQTPSTLVSNTGQSASATANITQQYAMEFTLGSHGQGYEISSVSIELKAILPSILTVSLWIGDHSSQSSSPLTKLFDFENPSSFQVGLNKFTAPAGVLAYPSVHYYIVLSDFGSSLSINETTSDAEDAGGETGATLADNAGGDSNVLRLAVEGSRRARGILASTYAQPFTGDQEIISTGDDCCFRMSVGAADRYLIRGFSWRSDDTTSRASGILNPWHLRDGTSASGAKQFRLINIRDVAGITEWTAPQGATVAGGSSKTYTFHQNLTTYLDHLGEGTRLGGVLTRIFATRSTGYDAPSAPGVTLSRHGDIAAAANPLLAVLGEPLDAMVQNLGQTDNSYVNLGYISFQVLSQGFTTGSNARGYELQGIGINIEGSESSFPDGPTSVSVAVHADSSGQPGAKLFDLVSPTEFAAGHSFFEAPPGTLLTPNTSYVLVWRYNDGTWSRLQRTLSDGEDSGALTGFSIANAFYRGADLSSLSENSNSNALEIAVYGGQATTPTVTAVALTSDPGTDAAYAIDVVVEASVTFSEAVDITGAPQLELDFAGAPKTANCAAATNTTTMVCSRTVAENDSAPNGIAIAANKLTFSGGGITLNGAARTAVLTHSAVAIDPAHKVDGVRPTLVTTGNDAPQTSTDGTKVILTFSEDLGLTDFNQFTVIAPGIVGGATILTENNKKVELQLVSVVITYGQTVNLTTLKGGAKDLAGNSNASLSNTPITNNVPQPPAVISTVEITSDPGMDSNYATGEDIEVTATFDQAVAVTGRPRIEVRLGGLRGNRWAEHASGSGTTALVFAYTVLATDESDADGIEVGRLSLPVDNVDLNGGTITVAASGADAALSFTPLASDSGHRVNWARPTLTGAVTSTDGTKVLLTFSEDLFGTVVTHALFTVKVAGTAVALSGSEGTVSGRVVTLTLTTALTSATQAVTVSYAKATAGTAGVQDPIFNEADSFTDQTVTNAFGSTTTPTVTGVEITSSSFNGFFTKDRRIQVDVTFSAAVDITGTPQLELDFAGTPKPANCTAATNTSTMECRYTIGGNDSAPNGIAIAANKLTLNGGTIYATGSTTINADLDHAAVAIDADQKVDGIRPTLVTTGANAPTTSADGTQVILTFSEDIGSVTPSLITIEGNSVALPTSGDNIVGPTVELTLTTALTASATNLTVALALDAVRDAPRNGNLAVAATAVTNAITDNATPAFSSPTATRSVPENTAANTNIGTALPAATDADNDPLTYTLEGADAASFGFDAATRQLSTASGVTYDHETQPSYSVTLKADDGNGGTDTIAVTITLTNVSEPPGRPAAPSVTATAGTTDSLDVNWTAPSNTGPAIDNYDLQYRQGSNGSWTNGPQNMSGTSATIGSLTEGASYQVRVLATNAEGDSPWSLPGSGQTGAQGAPDVPTGLSATPGNRQVMLSWVQPSGGAEVTDYEYEQDGSGTWISTGSTDTDYTVRNLTNGQSYTFRVRAANSAGASTASTASASVTPATVPGAPTNIGVTGGDQEVELNWTAPASNGGESITGYEYEQSGSGTWISTGSTATDYTVRNLTNGQPYRFRVRALNSVGEGAASAASPNVTPATEPDAPTGLSATVSDQRVNLNWTAPASNGGATILRYEYELDFSGAWTSTGGTATNYTVTGLTNGQSYDFRVRALNRVGAGQESLSEFATPTATLVAPDTPFGLNATPGNRQVMLSWVQPSGGAALTHYEYELDGSGTWISTGSTATSTTVMGLTNGQSYAFRVRAVNSAGASTASGSQSATPTTTAPEAPESLSFTPGDGQVTLRWRAPANDGGDPITHYEYEQDGSGTWISTGSTDTSHTVTGLDNGQTYIFRVRAVNAQGNGAVVTLEATPSPSTGRDGGGDDGPREPQPHAPRNLLVEGGDGQVTLTWEAPEDDGGSAITDYEYRIDGKGDWISIGSTGTTHTVTGLVNGQVYVFQVRAVNRNRKGRASNRVEATPRMPAALDFTHFANGADITSDLVFVNLSTQPTQPTLYFYDQEGQLIDPESVVDVTGDLMVTEDGALTVQTAMEPLGELTIRTHGRGDLVSGSVKVVADGPIGGLVRYSVPGVGVAGVGTSTPVRDALFPARRQAGGIRTAAAIHNLEAEAIGVSCRLMRGGIALEEVAITLEANGQTSWFIEDTFPTTDTSDFAGAVRCTAPGRGKGFTAIAVEMDTAGGIFTALPVVEVNRGRAEATTLDFAHFANGTWTTDLVFVNLETRQSGPPLSPFHTAIPPTRPAIYFYDTAGNPIVPTSVVDLTDDLEVTEDGALTVRTAMEPLGVVTITTHGRGDLVSGSVRVVSEGPIGGMLRFDHPGIGVAAVGASTPVSDAIFPVRRQHGGINTGVAIHNLESSPALVRCELMRGGVLIDAASIPLDAHGQTSWFIDAAFPDTDTSDFSGSVRCSAPGGDLFTAIAAEMDPGTRTFITLPVVPVPERMSQE